MNDLKMRLMVVVAATGSSLAGAGTERGARWGGPDFALRSADAPVVEGGNAPRLVGESLPEPTAGLTLEMLKARRLASVLLPATKARNTPEADSAAFSPAAGTPPKRDPTWIQVPTNTLGTGQPLWMRRDRQAAEARLAQARADIAEREAGWGGLDFAPQSADAAVVAVGDALWFVGESRPELAASSPLESITPRQRAAVLSPATRAGNTPESDAAAIAPAVFTPPTRDPTWIEVPGNTLGTGQPLWMRRDRQAAESRLAQARADIAEREAAQLATQQDDWNNVVVYGPHAPRWVGRNWYRPGLMAPRVGPFVTTIGESDDLYDRAQFEFGRVAAPPISPIIESQQQAQRRFGEVARPPITESQNQRDASQIRLRKGAPLPK